MVTKQTEADLIMEALGHQTRRDILRLLQANALPVGDIALQFPISRPAISKHLRILVQAGLVEYQPSGTRNIFRLKTVGFELARAYVASFWDEALVSFQQLAESKEQGMQ